MIVKNGIPLLAIIIELSIGIFVIIVFITLLQRYLKIKRKLSLTLSMAFLFYGLSVISSGLGKLLDYLVFGIPKGDNYTDAIAIIGYIFVAIANIYIIIFINELYFDETNLKFIFLIIIRFCYSGSFYS